MIKNDNQNQDRLIRCFRAVFPGLTTEQIISADRENVAGWDSLAGVTLLSVIEDEFEIALDPEMLDDSKYAFMEILSSLEAASKYRLHHG